MVAKAAPDVLGLGMGLTSWIFPDIPIAIKIGLTLLVIIIVIFLKMDKEKQTTTLKSTGKFIENYVMPGLGGGLRALFFALIGIILADAIFDTHLINRENYYDATGRSYGTMSTVSFFLHSLGNLTRTGNIILAIAVFIGAAKRINDVPMEKKKSA